MAEELYRALNLIDVLTDRLFQLHPLPRTSLIVDRLWFGTKVALAYFLYAIWAGLVVMIAYSVLTGVWVGGGQVAFQTFISAF